MKKHYCFLGSDPKYHTLLKVRESHTISFDKDVNAHDILSVVMDFMAGV